MPTTKEGVILAEEENLHSNVALSTVLETSAYFNVAANKTKIQFPSEKTKFAWLNMSRYYPTSQVARQGPVKELDYAIDKSIAKVSYKTVSGDSVTVDEHFDKYPIDAMIVVKEGKLLYERYKTMAPDEKHIWFSCSKITGATVMAFLEHEGKVDANKPVTHYLEELKGSVWDTVNVVEAMDMATGLNGTEHDEPNPDSRTNPDQIWFRWASTDAVGVLVDPKNRNESWVDVLRGMERVKPAY